MNAFILKISQPIDSKWIWDDSGSGSDDDVAIWSLKPPSSEYKCLGHVATQGNSIKPNLDNYRCVRNDYLAETTIRTSSIWDDSGSGADDDFGAFRILKNTVTISMGLFWSHGFHDGPTGESRWTYGLKSQSSLQCTSSFDDCNVVEFFTY